MKKGQMIFIGIVSFLFFCVFLFYTRLEMQRIIALRVKSAIEVSRTSDHYLNLMRRSAMDVREENGTLIYEPRGGDQ